MKQIDDGGPGNGTKALLMDGNRSAVSSDGGATVVEPVDSTKSSHLYLFLSFPLMALVVALVIWGHLHKLWAAEIWQGTDVLGSFDFITPGPVGRAIELVYWVNVAVQLRWLSNTASAVMHDKFSLLHFWVFWLLDTLNTPFVCWILLVILQSFTISFSNGLQLSLAEADITLFSAIAALLGISVGETQSLLMRISRRFFRRWAQEGKQEIEHLGD